MPASAAGFLASWAASRWIASLLFGVERVDLPTYAAVLAVLAATAAAAAGFPTWCTARIDPMAALQAE